MRLTSILLPFLSLASLAPLTQAKPTPQVSVRKQVYSTLKGLQAKTDVIVPKIYTLAKTPNVTAQVAKPVMYDLRTAFNDAARQVNAIKRAGNTTAAPDDPSDDELAELVASIINGVLDALNALVSSLANTALLKELLKGLDVAFNNLLNSLGGLISQLLILVAKLLQAVAKLLIDIALDLTYGTLFD